MVNALTGNCCWQRFDHYERSRLEGVRGADMGTRSNSKEYEYPNNILTKFILNVRLRNTLHQAFRVQNSKH